MFDIFITRPYASFLFMILRLTILFLRLYFRSETTVLREVRYVLNSQRSNRVENNKIACESFSGDV